MDAEWKGQNSKLKPILISKVCLQGYPVNQHQKRKAMPVTKSKPEETLFGKLGMTSERAKEIKDYVVERQNECARNEKLVSELLMEIYVEYVNERERAYALYALGSHVGVLTTICMLGGNPDNLFGLTDSE